MKQILAYEETPIPKDVKVQLAGRLVKVTGPRGTLTRNFNHLKITIRLVKKGKVVRAEIWFGNRANQACCRTVISHIKNMITGVTKGFLYRCKCAYNHFGFSVTQENNNTIEIRKFAGESRVRVLKLREGVTIVRPDNKEEKDDILISGNDIDAVSQTAADLNTSAVIRNKDLRRFLDGIFVASRGYVQE